MLLLKAIFKGLLITGLIFLSVWLLHSFFLLLFSMFSVGKVLAVAAFLVVWCGFSGTIYLIYKDNN